MGKISDTVNLIDVDRNMHAAVDMQNCARLRPAVQGLYGTVSGAGDGLSYIELQHPCDHWLCRSDLVADDRLSYTCFKVAPLQVSNFLCSMAPSWWRLSGNLASEPGALNSHMRDAS